MTAAQRRRLASILRQVLAVAALAIGSLQDANAIPGHYGWVLQAVGGVILAVEHALNGNEVPVTPASAPAVPASTATTTHSPVPPAAL